MAKVTLKFYSTLDDRIVREDGKLEAMNIAQLLELLAKKYGRAFREEIYDGGGIKNYYIVLHNGKAVPREKPGNVLLGDGDSVHIFPPVSGG